MNRVILLLMLSSVAIALISQPLAFAEVPREISFQGRLTGNGDGPVDLEVTFYDADVDGTVLWSEQHLDVERADGLLTILIGSQTSGGVPDSALDSLTGEVWMGVAVNGGVDLAPRMPLTMVPFAAKAKVAEGLVIPDTMSSIVTVNDSGRVGVNTSSPDATLHVKGSGSSGEVPENIGGLFVENGGVANNCYVFQTATLGGGKSFSITNAGNVGIGTTGPQARLDVRHTSKGGIQVFGNGNHDDSFLRLGQDPDHYISLEYDGSTDTLDVVGFDSHAGGEISPPHMSIKRNSGNIGIGTTAPESPLEVVAPPGEPSITTRGGNDYAVREGEYIDIGHWDGAEFTSRMRITPDGKVGIDVQSPQSKLTVDGDIRLLDGGILFPDGTYQETAAPPVVDPEYCYYEGARYSVGARCQEGFGFDIICPVNNTSRLIITCQADGSWSDAEALCVNLDECGTPGD